MAITTASCAKLVSRAGVFWILACIALGAGLDTTAGAQTQGPTLNSPRVPKPGETRTTKYNEQIITAVYAGRQGALDCWNLKSSNGSTGQSCNTVEGNLVSRQGNVGVNVQMNPHSGFLSFPLYVGKQWEMQYTSTLSGEGARNQVRKAQVISYERITVPAGTFDAFKIKSTRNVWGGNMQDSVGARQGTLGSSRFNVQEGIYYYTDKVGIVKQDEGTDHFELIDYSPK